MSRWTAEITNDPERDYSLIIEILEEEQARAARARIERSGQELVLRVYVDDVQIPIDWLKEIIEQAQKDAAHM
jgi:hypothetical protein